jgi:hypothetical protein
VLHRLLPGSCGGYRDIWLQGRQLALGVEIL